MFVKSKFIFCKKLLFCLSKLVWNTMKCQCVCI
ncbi:MAG TPA: hypothetical protein DCS70_04550 [Acinetobacter nosocomialis]|nr:hypothetical protein DC362_14095 [Acinetobacter nosocomialis]HAM64628.1 hypothetical protein [Acinetobacter nosocomialis]HAS96637.1 hypothetical protein [Acinetobacter nosocomialis]